VIYYLENGEFVFVTAYTSAGKTVVAEYAFSLATKVCVPSAPLHNYVFFSCTVDDMKMQLKSSEQVKEIEGASIRK
jgi:hypothetical protein